MALGPSFYPIDQHLLTNVHRRICSEHVGIMHGSLVSPISHVPGVSIRSLTGQMPHYHKVILESDSNIQYHLAGYGLHYDEALVRYIGEGIERSSSISAIAALADRIVYGSHLEMDKRGQVPPLGYLNAFSPEDLRRLPPSQDREARPLSAEEPLGWIECPSLIDATRTVWLPAQMLFMGYKPNVAKGERRILPCFSTGTAAHLSFQDAMKNALLEVIQIDALMVHWYCRLKSPEIITDDQVLRQLIGSDLRFRTTITDLSDIAALPAYVTAATLTNAEQKRPLVVFGSHAETDIVRCVYRSVMEARAITFLAFYGALYAPEAYFPGLQDRTFRDLDSNVGFYSDPDNSKAKIAAFASLIEGRRTLSALKERRVAQDLEALLKALTLRSEYACYLEVTPPEVYDLGWRVVRVVVPELVTMCLPGVPYSNHPRFRQFGGVTNDLPHPLP